MALEIVRNDDFIEYFLYPNIDQASESEEEDVLIEFLKKINEISSNYTSSYIWHKDPFVLKARNRNSHLLNPESKEQLPAHLHGITYFGDNIQDEWFLVSLLFHLSREVAGLIVRACDSDGEFLLIEAAEHLPQWANPETCEQRVYIYDGHILLVQNSPSNTKHVLPVSDAIKKIRENPKIFGVSKNVEKSVTERIQEFPGSINENFHRQTVYVPIAVAALLHHNPQLIAPAVQAFCNRDPIDMKACRAMRYFPPENRVYTSVVFTKCLYAMMTHSNYLPDRRTGWQIPSSNSPHFKAHLLGVKVACGFEILASQAKSSSNDIEQDREWIKYLESLKSRNYFQDLIEGSKGHTELLATAKDYYIQNRDNMRVTPKIGDEILRDMKQLDISFDDFKKLEQSLPDSDSDNWLNIAPEDLDEMLMKRYGVKNLLTKDPNANAGHLTEMLTDFLDQESEFDGVDVNKNVPSITDRIKYRENGQVSDSPLHLAGGCVKSSKIDFDPDAFSTTVQNLLDLVIPEDNWDSHSDMSDYENDDDLLAKNIDEISKKAHVKGHKKKNAKKSNIDVYMEQMDRELANTTIGKSFEKKAAPEKAAFDDGFDDIEDFRPVDVDMNAIKNMMESYQLQGASAGPTSNLLSTLLGADKKQTDV